MTKPIYANDRTILALPMTPLYGKDIEITQRNSSSVITGVSGFLLGYRGNTPLFMASLGGAILGLSIRLLSDGLENYSAYQRGDKTGQTAIIDTLKGGAVTFAIGAGATVLGLMSGWGYNLLPSPTRSPIKLLLAPVGILETVVAVPLLDTYLRNKWGI